MAKSKTGTKSTNKKKESKCAPSGSSTTSSANPITQSQLKQPPQSPDPGRKPLTDLINLVASAGEKLSSFLTVTAKEEEKSIQKLEELISIAEGESDFLISVEDDHLKAHENWFGEKWFGPEAQAKPGDSE